VLNLFDQKAVSSVYVLQTAAGQGINIDEPAFFAGNLDFQSLLTSQGVVIDPRFPAGELIPVADHARVGVKFIF